MKYTLHVNGDLTHAIEGIYREAVEIAHMVACRDHPPDGVEIRTGGVLVGCVSEGRVVTYTGANLSAPPGMTFTFRPA